MAKTISAFKGFPTSGIELLAELPARDKKWFEDWRDLYEESLLQPARELVVSLGEKLQTSVSSSITAEPSINGSISPIFRDLRFSADKSVFKDNLMLNFWEAPSKKAGPTLRLRITPKMIGFATGSVFDTQPRLDKWRSALDNDISGNSLQSSINQLANNQLIDISEPELKKPPRPYTNEHPRADLLRRKSFQVRWQEKTPDSIHTANFVDWCDERFAKLKDLHTWLKNNL
ncbi:DUF2461 domain-containing protein [Puniceicoccaceae bacterium K14]|nr:DUF2461 domain-containing protein [Puniceicoccaceae bacterium K14]